MCPYVKRIIVIMKRIIVIKGGRWQLGGYECKWKRHGRGAQAQPRCRARAATGARASTSWVRLARVAGADSQAAYDKLLIQLFQFKSRLEAEDSRGGRTGQGASRVTRSSRHSSSNQRLVRVLRAACCVLRAACCVLRAACCVPSSNSGRARSPARVGWWGGRDRISEAAC
jgi:hypothetical protein